MKIGIAGGSGLIGRNLAKKLLLQGNQVVVYSRQSVLPGELALVSGITLVKTSMPSPEELSGLDVLINLTGESVIGERWSEKRKKGLKESRVAYSSKLIGNLLAAEKKPSVYIQGSAIGFYGMREGSEPVFKESSNPGDDFLAKLCVDWENESKRAAEAGVRTILIRTGIVLAKEAGALKQMLPAFQMFAGGPIASGKQVMSWIHIDDMCNGIIHLIKNGNAEGVFNFTAPNPVSNEVFSRALGEVLGRPSFMRVPPFALYALYGESAEVILKGQNVIPEKLIEFGFQFQYSEIKQALKNLLK